MIDLTGSPLLVTEKSRKVLEYVVQCALPLEVTAQAAHLGEMFRFQGDLGIAPDWRTGALTDEEQAAVSACLLARTNAFGVPVRISLRSRDAPLSRLPSLFAGREERRAYPVREGAFFGNVFSGAPTAYACRGDTSPETESILRRAKRICTLPTDHLTPDGLPISACGFVVLGQCDDLDVSRVKAEYADRAIEVYLPAN